MRHYTDGLRQTRTSGSTTSKLLWDTVGGLPLLLDDGTSAYVYGPGGTPIEQVNDSTAVVQYLHADNVGSIRAITSSTGAVAGTADFDAYGRVVSATGSTSAIGYTGALTDATTGLVYLRARDYDPATGQFLQVDPAIDSTGQPYAYTGNDPVNATDPTGLYLFAGNDFATCSALENVLPLISPIAASRITCLLRSTKMEQFECTTRRPIHSDHSTQTGRQKLTSSPPPGSTIGSDRKERWCND